MQRKLVYSCFFVVLVIGLILSGCSDSNVNDSEKVASVNGESITKEEFERQVQFMKASYEQQQMEWNDGEMRQGILDQMINNTLLQQEAQKQGVVPSEEEVEKNLESIKMQYPSEEEFNQALQEQDLTLEKLKEDISTEISINSYLEKEIPREELQVTEEEVEGYYDQYANNLESQGQDEVPGIEELRPQIEQMLQNQKFNTAIGKVVEELKSKSEIEKYI